MIISARPYPSIKTLFSNSDYFEFSQFEFYKLGREALLSCIVRFGIKSGDSIIVPAYICESTINPIRAYGINLIFIDIDKDLSISVIKLKKILISNNIKAILLVHYFGLTQEFDKQVILCHQFGVKVIEDASHSLISQLLIDKNKIISDAEIFSMRKSFPIFDGGALRMKSNLNYLKNNTIRPLTIYLDLKYLCTRLIEKIITWLRINIYGNFLNKIKTQSRSLKKIGSFNQKIKLSYPSWQLQKYLANTQYQKESQDRILRNYDLLNNGLKQIGFKIFAESLHNNVVPQFFIIYDDKGGLINYLRNRGVGACRWPGEEIPQEINQNPDKYPNTIIADKELALLPINQSLGNKEINYMIKVLQEWKK